MKMPIMQQEFALWKEKGWGKESPQAGYHWVLPATLESLEKEVLLGVLAYTILMGIYKYLLHDILPFANICSKHFCRRWGWSWKPILRKLFVAASATEMREDGRAECGCSFCPFGRRGAVRGWGAYDCWWKKELDDGRWSEKRPERGWWRQCRFLFGV